MDAIGSDCQSHIQPIIDNQGNSVLLQERLEAAGLVQKLPGGTMLLPQLDAGDTPADCGTDNVHSRATLRQAPVGH